jgi:YD repeat-containing protein
MGESHDTFRYDDHGNIVHQFNEEIQREMGMDEAGQVELVKENSHRGESKMDYVYDAHGNSTEMIVSGRPEPNPNFYPSNIERRQITYY